MADNSDGVFGREMFGGKTWTLIAAVVLVAAVVAGIVAIVATHHSSSSNAATKPAPVVGECPLASKVSTNVPTSAPSTKWVSVRGYELPVTSAGPLYRDGGSWTCYQHSLMGAVETVGGLTAAGLTGDRNAASALFAPGSVSATELSQLVPEGGQQAQAGVRIAGFEVSSTGTNTASVTLLTSCTVSSCGSPFYSTAYQLRWAGQWLITNGGGNTTPESNAAGAIEWLAP